MPNAALLTNAELYDPVRILQDPAFRIINSKDQLPKEKDANLACPCLPSCSRLVRARWVADADSFLPVLDRLLQP